MPRGGYLNYFVVIISQCLCALKHHIVHLKCIQFLLSVITQNKARKSDNIIFTIPEMSSANWVSLDRITVSLGLRSSGDSKGESIFLPFLDSRVCPHSLPHDFFCLQSQQWPGWSFFASILVLTLCLLLSCLRMLIVNTGHTGTF